MTCGHRVACMSFAFAAALEVTPSADSRVHWITGNKGHSCHWECLIRGKHCVDSAKVWPKSEDNFVEIAKLWDFRCKSLVAGNGVYDPSSSDGHCGWQEDEQARESEYGGSRCAAVPALKTQRFCPCLVVPVTTTATTTSSLTQATTVSTNTSAPELNVPGIEAPMAGFSDPTPCEIAGSSVCPTSNGVMLPCCTQLMSISSPTQTCQAHDACNTLIGDCCPTASGVMLPCCGQKRQLPNRRWRLRHPVQDEHVV